jgi:hypothetical protein
MQTTEAPSPALAGGLQPEMPKCTQAESPKMMLLRG